MQPSSVSAKSSNSKVLSTRLSLLSSISVGWLGPSQVSHIVYLDIVSAECQGNLLMAKFPISKYLGFNIFLWGVFLIAQGGAKDFKDMAILRVISGAFEAVAKPGFMAITAMWFTRSQQPIVVGCWYASQGVGIGLGGIIGYGIGQIKASISAWRYEFILIGVACAVWGIAMGIIIPDSPYTSKRFTRDEKLVIMSRKRDDYHAVDKRQTKWDQVKETALDIKTYLYVCFLRSSVYQLRQQVLLLGLDSQYS